MNIFPDIPSGIKEADQKVTFGQPLLLCYGFAVVNLAETAFGLIVTIRLQSVQMTVLWQLRFDQAVNQETTMTLQPQPCLVLSPP